MKQESKKNTPKVTTKKTRCGKLNLKTEKVLKPRARKKSNADMKASAIPMKDVEDIKNLRERNSVLEKRVAELLKEKTDFMLELERIKRELQECENAYYSIKTEYLNMAMKKKVMLGQILKGLFLMGVTPDMVMEKCSQMFEKKK